MPSRPWAYCVFINDSHRDKSVAEAVCAGLESRGIRWIAARDVHTPQDLELEIPH